MQGSTTAARRPEQCRARGSRSLAAAVACVAIGVGVRVRRLGRQLADGIKIARRRRRRDDAGAARACSRERRASRADVPVTFRRRHDGPGRSVPTSSASQEDWEPRVDAAAGQGERLRVVRGYKRLGLRALPGDVDARARLRRGGGLQGRPAREGYRPAAPRRAARPARPAFDVERAARRAPSLDRNAAAALVVAALAGSAREPVELPVRDRPAAGHGRALAPRARARGACRLGAGHAHDRDRELRASQPKQLAAMLRAAEQEARRSSRSAGPPRTPTSRSSTAT